MIIRMLSVSILALSAGAMLEAARANQFFVCEDGRTVEVARGELEAAKREIPCVAKHFGLTIKTAKAAPNKPKVSSPAAPAASSSKKVEIVLPVRKPQSMKLRASATTAPPNLDRPTSQQVAEASSTSYRRVRVINAQTPSGRWFLHTR